MQTYQIHHLGMVVGLLGPCPVLHQLAGVGQFSPPVGHCVPAACHLGVVVFHFSWSAVSIILFVVHRLMWIRFRTLLPILALLHVGGVWQLTIWEFHVHRLMWISFPTLLPILALLHVTRFRVGIIFNGFLSPGIVAQLMGKVYQITLLKKIKN